MKPFAVLAALLLSTSLPAAWSQTSSAPGGSVTMYGTVDTYLNLARSGATRLRRLEDGGNTASRLAFTGSEDLGGGLRALFLLEAGFAPDTGAGTLPGPSFAFTRQALVGLAGRWGRLDAGRMYTPTFYALFRADPYGVNSVFSPLNIVAATDAQPGLNAFAARASNMVRYRSPEGAPWIVDVAYAAGETASGSGNLWGTTLGWQQGPWYAAYAFQRARAGSTAAPVADPSTTTYHTLSTGWRFTPELRATANWMRNSVNLPGVPRADVWNLGVGWNVGLWQLEAGAARRDVKDSHRDQWTWTLGTDYLLSKRTALYARVLQLTNAGGSAVSLAGVPVLANSGNGITSYAVGLRHNF